tara:strand:- start:363 stop:1379 length:1017 start_codon:yes stop_codon:yes gene_type:complete
MYFHFIKIIIIMVILVFIILLIDHNKMEKLLWPFINIIDEGGRAVKIICLRGPLERDEDIIKFKNYKKKGYLLLGCSSYLSFPLRIQNPHAKEDLHLFNGKRYDTMVHGWLHCFKEEGKILTKNKLLLSESDFMDNIQFLRDYDVKNKKIRYDFICFCPSDGEECNRGWNHYNKNWSLSKDTIEYLCNSLKLHGVLVGREHCTLNINGGNLKRVRNLPYYDFLDYISASRFMVIPNREDASPRIIAEGLLLDTPLLMSEGILGGWKYINKKTGVFYTIENIEIRSKELLYNIQEGNYSPREYYLKNYGRNNSGKLLRDFVCSINPSFSRYKYLYFPIS